MKVEVDCPCGVLFNSTVSKLNKGRGKYCSKNCLYEYRTRPSGLEYKIVSENSGWVKAGERLSPHTEFKPGEDGNPKYKPRKGERMSPKTEFKPGHGYKGGRVHSIYGVTQEQWNDQLELQNSRCAICSAVFVDSRSIHTDHCHKTKKVRGILCLGCNVGLGMMKDDIEILRSAIAYLELGGVWQ